jgi:hypothetical protein
MGNMTILFFISIFPICPSENKCGKCFADMLISLLAKLIGSRFRVQGSKVTTDGHCSPY